MAATHNPILPSETQDWINFTLLTATDSILRKTTKGMKQSDKKCGYVIKQ